MSFFPFSFPCSPRQWRKLSFLSLSLSSKVCLMSVSVVSYLPRGNLSNQKSMERTETGGEISLPYIAITYNTDTDTILILISIFSITYQVSSSYFHPLSSPFHHHHKNSGKSLINIFTTTTISFALSLSKYYLYHEHELISNTIQSSGTDIPVKV